MHCGLALLAETLSPFGVRVIQAEEVWRDTVALSVCDPSCTTAVHIPIIPTRVHASPDRAGLSLFRSPGALSAPYQPPEKATLHRQEPRTARAAVLAHSMRGIGSHENYPNHYRSLVRNRNRLVLLLGQRRWWRRCQHRRKRIRRSRSWGRSGRGCIPALNHGPSGALSRPFSKSGKPSSVRAKGEFPSADHPFFKGLVALSTRRLSAGGLNLRSLPASQSSSS